MFVATTATSEVTPKTLKNIMNNSCKVFVVKEKKFFFEDVEMWNVECMYWWDNDIWLQVVYDYKSIWLQVYDYKFWRII